MEYILFYGNCQVGAIKDILEKSLQNYKIDLILCWCDNIDKQTFLNKIKRSSIIITQPIHKNYRNTDYLDTEFILNNAEKDTKIIIFPSMHFDFYYFDYKYKFLNDKLLQDPSDYHYIGLLESCIEKKELEYFYDNYLNNYDLKTEEELKNIANISLCELEKRENEMENYKITKDCYIIS